MKTTLQNDMISDEEARTLQEKEDYININQGKEWPDEHKALLAELYKSGCTIPQLRWKFGRSETSILVYLAKLNCITEEYKNAILSSRKK